MTFKTKGQYAIVVLLC